MAKDANKNSNLRVFLQWDSDLIEVNFHYPKTLSIINYSLRCLVDFLLGLSNRSSLESNPVRLLNSTRYFFLFKTNGKFIRTVKAIRLSSDRTINAKTRQESLRKGLTPLRLWVASTMSLKSNAVKAPRCSRPENSWINYYKETLFVSFSLISGGDRP